MESPAPLSNRRCGEAEPKHEPGKEKLVEVRKKTAGKSTVEFNLMNRSEKK